MAGNEIGIQRVSDSNLLKIFVEQTLVETEKFGFGSAAMVTVTIQGSSFHIRNAEGEDDENNCYLKDGQIEHEFIKSILDDSSSNNKVSRISLVDRTIHQHFTISYARSSESLIDKLISPSQQTNTKTLVVITHICNLLGESPLNNYQITEEFNIASVHHDVLTRLEGLSIELIKKQAEQAKEYELEKKQFIDQQLEDYKQRATELEIEHKDKLEKLEANYKERNEQLDIREKQIEDADNTTARRKTTTSMLEEVQEKAKRFNFSQTVTIRSWLAIVFAMLLGFLAGHSTYSTTLELYSYFSDIDKLAEKQSTQINEVDSTVLETQWQGLLARKDSFIETVRYFV